MYQAPTVKKAFQIIELIAGEDKQMTISDLSRELGISKSTIHGITRALEETGALYRDKKSKRYTLGTVLFELAKADYSRVDMKDTARPIMEALMRSTGQSVFLGIRSGNHVSIIDIVESTQDLKITSPIGTRVPLLAGALGKAFLASMDKKRALSLVGSIGLRRFTNNSITDSNRYLKIVEEARKSGYGLDDEEYIQGVRAVASVIRGSGQPMWAVWIVGFTPSMREDRMADIARETRRAADEISSKIASQSFDRQKLLSYFQVNENCNGCLACVQNCPARALDAREADGVQTLLHNMARCARCATCWRVCPQDAIEFRHMLENRWDEAVTHALVRCRICNDVVYTQPLTDSLEAKVREIVEPLCSRHRMERHADILSGRLPVAGGGAE